MTDVPVVLNRKFSLASEEAAESGDYAAYSDFSQTDLLCWEDLFKKTRVVILAQAGAGKTFELENATRVLRNKGKPAFFVRLEYLKNGVSLALDGNGLGNFDQLEAWKATTEKGWLFLDSVDEAKLNNPSDFDLALRKLSQYLGNRAQHTHIVMSCRPTWEHETEPALVRRHLPYHPKSYETKHDGNLSSISRENTEKKSTTSKQEENLKKQPEIFSLSPLDTKQIKVFLAANGITDAQEMIEEMNGADVMQLASRPRDLEYIIEYWKKNKAIGSKLEFIRSSIEHKLVETDTKRSEQKPLSKKEAWDAAQLIAVATTLTPFSRIAFPSQREISGAFCIESILPDWDSKKHKALLERPLFDNAAYGTVRFHDRDSREFLVAEWIGVLLLRGSRTEIEKLFFKTQYDIEVIRPKLRSILPWLALKDDRIRERTLKVSPKALLKGGDPSQFPAKFRASILTSVCHEIAEGKSLGNLFYMPAMQRFAKADIAKTIHALLDTHKDHDEIRQFLLQMIRQGKLEICKNQALQFALDQNADCYTRICAIRACRVVCTAQEQQKIVDQFANSNTDNDLEILSEMISAFAPSVLRIPALLKILKRLPELEQYKREGMDVALLELAKSLTLPKVKDFIEGLHELLIQEPHDCGISVRYTWMLEAAIFGVAHLVKARDPFALSPIALELISQSGTSRDFDYDYSFKNTKNTLDDLVLQWPELNKAVFWYGVHRAKNETGTEITSFRQAWGYCFPSGVSFTTALEWMKEKEITADKQVALSIAFSIYCGEKRDSKKKQSLLTAVHGNEVLEKALENHMNQPIISNEIKEWEKNNKEQIKNDKEKQEKNLADWRNYATTHLNLVGWLDGANESRFYPVQQFLFERMQKLHTDNNRWTYTNWQDLKADQNEEVASTYQNFLVNCWRKYRPVLASEGNYNRSSTKYAEIYGLSGLGIEANESKDWPANLTQADAELAGRYLLLELNDFPDWLTKLHSKYPDVVEKILLNEINWELFEYVGENPCDYVLGKIMRYAKWLKPHVGDSIFKLLQKKEPTHLSALRDALGIITDTDCFDIFFQLANLAKEKISKGTNYLPMWYAIWVSVAPDDAVSILREYLGKLNSQEEATEFSMQFVINLTGTRHSRDGVNHDVFKQPKHLGDIYSLVNQYVHMSKDIERDNGVCYSPKLRDHAQDSRDFLLSALTDIPGKASYMALKKLALNHPYNKARPWMESRAMSHTIKEADIGEWSVANVLQFQKNQDYQPSDAKHLFEKTCSRLADLKSELEDGDDSPAGTWKRAKSELELRVLIANWLSTRSNSMYSVHQEEELADKKKPDIRIHGVGFDSPVPVELKIADNWSGKELFERLENQLCNDYLRDCRTSYGIFLLLYQGEKKHWRHRKTNKNLNFEALVNSLQGHVKNYISDRNDIEEISVVGLDLTKRAIPKRSV